MSNYVQEPIIIVVLMLIYTMSCIAIYTLIVNRQLTYYCNNYYFSIGVVTRLVKGTIE